MKKTKLFLLGAILASFSFSATAEDTPFNQDNITSTYNHGEDSERYLNSFKLTNSTGSDVLLNEPTFPVNQSRKSGSSIYYNLTEGDNPPIFQTKAGNTVSFSNVDWNKGSWMHGYLFIDYNRDGGFNSKLNNTGLGNAYKSQSFGANFDAKLNPSEDGELVAFSSYELTGSSVESQQQYVKSNGTASSGNAGVVPPAFTIPADLKPGIYNALYKIDWSDISQHGNPGEYILKDGKWQWNNRIGDNGGVIVQFQIEVVESAWLSDLDGLNKVTDFNDYPSLYGSSKDPNVDVRARRSTNNKTITINGTTYSEGVGTHALSIAYIELNGATDFYSVFGLDDEEQTNGRKDATHCNVNFRVTLYKESMSDSTQVYFENVVMYGNVHNGDIFNTQTLDNINLADYKYMKLAVEPAYKNNGTTVAWGDHADWADARFIYKGIKPRFVTTDEMFQPEIRHTATIYDKVSAYDNAAFVTVEYDARFIPEEHNLIAVATQINDPQSSATASYFTTLALTQEEEREALNGVIQATKAENEGKILTYALRKDESSAKLLLEEPIFNENGYKVDNKFQANTSYTYSIQLKTVLGDEEQDTAEPQTVSFTTANNGGTLGVEDVVEDDSNAPVQYFNLQGIQVNQPAAGQIYIMRQGKTVKKVLVK